MRRIASSEHAGECFISKYGRLRHPQKRKDYLIRELADAGAQDGVHLEALHLLGVLGDDVAQLQPQLVLALPLQRPEGVIVHQLRQLPRGFPPISLHVRPLPETSYRAAPGGWGERAITERGELV